MFRVDTIYRISTFLICQASIDSKLNLFFYPMNQNLLYQLVERIGNFLRVEQRLAGKAFGLQEVHLQVLLYLSLCNRYSNTPIAVTEYLNATKGTVSQSLKVLETKGFIVKQNDTNDKRVVHLILTEEGQKIIKDVIPPAIFGDAINSLTSPQVKSLESNLTLLLTALQQANQLRSFGVCQTCRFFTKKDSGFLCGLTQESLSEDDASRICREHESL